MFDINAPFRDMLERVLRNIVESGNEIADAYLTTRVLASTAFVQAAQQQQ